MTEEFVGTVYKMYDDFGHNIDFLKELREATTPGSARASRAGFGALAETSSIPVKALAAASAYRPGQVLVAASTSTFAVCAKMENSKERNRR
jgi:hypothetical protein